MSPSPQIYGSIHRLSRNVYQSPCYTYPMDISTFLAKVMGLYLVIMAFVVMINKKTLFKAVKEYTQNSALLLLGGAFALILGLLVVVSHNLWVADWRVIVTIFGWLTLIKGFTLVMNYYNKVVKWSLKMFTSRWFALYMLAMFGFGSYLIYVGFYL
jgi:hypothetical protein